MRSFLETHIRDAKKEIYIYNQTVTDPMIKKILEDREKHGIQVYVCVSKRTDDEESGESIFSGGLDFVVSRGPYLHAKVILIDGRDILL
jgi:phosphatidylserine/phosphatidylglycerophosphate/cardiolipin synthase-like enzyme